MFLDRLQRPRRQLHFHKLLQGVRKEAFGLHVGQPRPAGFVFGEGDVVAVLFGLALEETQLCAFERLGHYGGVAERY